MTAPQGFLTWPCRQPSQELRDEHDAEASYSYVAKYVARRRPEIEAERKGRAESLEGFVPQLKEPGAEAEVDFGPVTVELDGREAACHPFAYRLSFSGMGVHRVYASCVQEALLEGHVTAFAVTGGVPREHIRYDNLTPAVTKVLKGRDRKENARWLSFRSWHGFEAFYCEPGIGGAHEKGGVEGEIGRFPREAAGLGTNQPGLTHPRVAQDNQSPVLLRYFCPWCLGPDICRILRRQEVPSASALVP